MTCRLMRDAITTERAFHVRARPPSRRERRAAQSERFAASGRNGTEGGDERGGGRARYRFEPQLSRACSEILARWRAFDRRSAYAKNPSPKNCFQSRAARADWRSAARPHPSAFVAAHDAPLIGERAAKRVRSATEGGDEYAGARRASYVRALASRTGSNAGDLTRWRPLDRLQRGRARLQVAMITPVRRGRLR